MQNSLKPAVICFVTSRFPEERATDMEALLESLGQLLIVFVDVLTSLVQLVVPWIPLIVWIGFWLFAVNWSKLHEVLRLRTGGWVGIVLIGVVMVLVWGSVAPPEAGEHNLFGLTVGNFVGKLVYVTTLFCIMFLCGAVQLSGSLGECCRFADEESEPESHAAHH